MRITNHIPTWIIYAVLPFALSCQSDPARDFTKLHPGMEKGDVLDIMGSPNVSQRWHGMDRWTYIIYGNGNQSSSGSSDATATAGEKEVHFADGRAVYVGAKYQPKVSAEEQDRVYDAQNAEIEKTYAAQRAQSRQALPKYQEEVEGAHEIRYVPAFVPVQ